MDQIAQLCDNANEFSAIPAELTIIGSGSADQAARARGRMQAPFTFLVDPDRVSYQAADLRKDFFSTFNWRTFPAALRAFKRGHRQGRTQGDAFQQGGVIAFNTSGSIIFKHINRFGGDQAAPEEILAALELNTQN